MIQVKIQLAVRWFAVHQPLIRNPISTLDEIFSRSTNDDEAGRSLRRFDMK